MDSLETFRTPSRQVWNGQTDNYTSCRSQKKASATNLVFTLRHAVPGETVPRLPGPAAEGGDSEALALGQGGEADPLLGLTGA